MKTLFKINHYKEGKRTVRKIINEINEGCEWVLTDGIPTRKFDGSACLIKDGILYKRFDAKINKKTGKRRAIPEGAIQCISESDPITGHFPHWILVDFDEPENWMHKEAFENIRNDYLYIYELINGNLKDGTYELCGPNINGNKDCIPKHIFIPHGIDILNIKKPYSFEKIKEFLAMVLIEGIVFHHKTDNRMCKIRRKDFGFNW